MTQSIVTISVDLEEQMKNDSNLSLNKQEGERLIKYITSSRYLFLRPGLYQALTDHNAFIAGGFLTSRFFNILERDVDFFFRYEKDFQYLYNLVVNDHTLFDKFETDNAFSFKNEGRIVQFIKKFYGEPEDIISKFDLSPCQAAFDLKTKKFYYTKSFDNSLSLYELPFSKKETKKVNNHWSRIKQEDDVGVGNTKVMFYNINCRSPLTSIFRVMKYINKGFRIPNFELVKLTLHLASQDISTYGKLKGKLNMKLSDSFNMEEINKILDSNEFTNEEFKLEDFLILLSAKRMFSKDKK